MEGEEGYKVRQSGKEGNVFTEWGFSILKRGWAAGPGARGERKLGGWALKKASQRKGRHLSRKKEHTVKCCSTTVASGAGRLQAKFCKGERKCRSGTRRGEKEGGRSIVLPGYYQNIGDG